MDDPALSPLPFLLRRGADHADLRRVSIRRESLRVRNGVVVSIGRISESGWGVRVLAGGAWGFAATDEPEALETTGRLALEIGSSRMALKIHESVGHPTGLDRILGTELSPAGGSFLDVGMRTVFAAPPPP
jgi:predicted Zn-dependent protease